jgi:hypothetical protein
MRRRLLNLAAAGSLALCVATAALSLSTWQADALLAQPVHVGPLAVRSAHGESEFSCLPPGAFAVSRLFLVYPSEPTLANACRWHVLGFGLGVDLFGSHRVVVPHWFIALITMVLPAWWLLRRHRAHRAARLGICRSCGYDLRATPARCPECGAPAAGTGGG